ncbi:unnamed protein product [Acanthoscelides obtectus]|uniref:Putative nuclease HARBI1 n=1 Tax=Acanthoscelides obtectus TaxID=200917 RepID=A0A9P0LXC4_ACAOB|nr:unnamed protein product [Acanthoscelides obtectus]CAK1672563.1 Putative nuclease HARBI1 [Acanthoscelides obtectus]
MKICLRYLGDPGCQQGFGQELGVSQATVSRTVDRVVNSIVAQSNEWIKFPTTNHELMEAKRIWQSLYKFPTAIGVIHMGSLKPNRHGDEYINRKGKPTLNVQATCDAREMFTSIDVSWPGSVHDSRIWRNSQTRSQLRTSKSIQQVLELLGDRNTNGQADRDIERWKQPQVQYHVLLTPVTCRVIVSKTAHVAECDRLMVHILSRFPKTSEEWQEIAYNIETRWNFPNCGGSIDGKHLRIVKPANSGSYFFNYKDYHSIVLMALVNADYEFIYVNVGCNGRVSDGGVLEYTKFYDKLIEKKLNLPSNDVTKHNLNFVFVADDAFALHENILKPFPGNNLTKEESIFNYRLSRVRRTVENAFGILANRFRVFHTPINMQPDKIDKIVLAACALHNFLRRSKTSYITRNDVDTEIIDTGDIIRGDWRAERPLDNLQPGYGRNASREAKENRII